MTGDRLAQLMQWAVENQVTMRAEHIEKMAAAYLLKTDIDPREVELIERRQDYGIEFYFRRKQEWISVKDKLPDDARPVLVAVKFMRKHYHEIGNYAEGTWSLGQEGYGGDVTHWMELPPLDRLSE